MNEVRRQQIGFLLLAGIVCMVIALLLRADVALQQATAPAPRPHAVLRPASPATTLESTHGRPAAAPGYIEVWAMLADADDYRAAGADRRHAGAGWPRARPALYREKI